MKSGRKREFSIGPLEFVVVVSIALVIVVFGIRGINSSRNKALESETKANLHTIQVALERYSTDHSGAYPNYIFGGDQMGWDTRSGCIAIRDAESDEFRPPLDPLLEYSYLAEYPENPFADQQLRGHIQTATGGEARSGMGDVRFGYYSEKMGNCLDDPRFLFVRSTMAGADLSKNPTRLQFTSLINQEMKTGVLCDGRYNPFYCMGGYPLSAVGDIPGTEDRQSGVLKYWWPGEFLYRAGGDYFIGGLNHISPEYEDIWGWPYMRLNKYVLGCYGSTLNQGYDVIRLTTLAGDPACLDASWFNGELTTEFYQDNEDLTRPYSHPDDDVLIKFAPPEIFGGGNSGVMPQFPYFDSVSHLWLIGAPDGYRDGVILLTYGHSAYGTAVWLDSVTGAGVTPRTIEEIYQDN